MTALIGNIWNSRTSLILLLLLGTIAVIASVLAFEHLGGYIPCALCLEQRVPYYYAIALMLVIAIIDRVNVPDQLIRLGLLVTGLLVLWSLGLGAYHSGVEWGWWAGPTECAAGADDGNTSIAATNLLDQLSSSKPPSCDEAAGRFLGLSFAGWNVVVSAGIALLAFRAAMIKRAA